MYFITMGTVDVVSEDGEVVYNTLKEGEFFGESSCLCGALSLISFRYIYGTVQAQHRTRAQISICSRQNNGSFKGRGTHFTHKYSPAMKNG